MGITFEFDVEDASAEDALWWITNKKDNKVIWAGAFRGTLEQIISVTVGWELAGTYYAKPLPLMDVTDVTPTHEVTWECNDKLSFKKDVRQTALAKLTEEERKVLGV